MNDPLFFAASIVNNIVDWLQGKARLDRCAWSPELTKLFDLEKQNQLYQQFQSFGVLIAVGEITRYALYGYFIKLDYASSHWFLTIKLNHNQQVITLLLTANNRQNNPNIALADELNQFIKQEYLEISNRYNLAIEACITSHKKHSPKALVLFIQGSGASDKDLNVGYCKPFYDLAIGLASNNIASIRFDKRSWSYPFINVKDPNDEIIDDAVAAAKLIRQKFKATKLPLIILGHSQGATFVTQVAEQLKPIPAGFILLAAPSSNDLHARILEQLDYLIQKNPGNDVELLKMQKEVIDSLNHWQSYTQAVGDVRKEARFMFNLSAEYLSYLDSYNPIEVIDKANIATLILQAQDDYKVLENKDFKAWKKGLNSNKNVSYKLYGNLEHCFVDRKCAEKHIFSRLDSTVIEDISKWIIML